MPKLVRPTDAPAPPRTGGARERVDTGTRWLVLLVPALLIMAAFFFLPIAQLVLRSIQDVPAGASWYQNYETVATSPVVREIFLRTLRTALLVTAVCLGLGYPYAYLMSVSGPRTRAILLLAVLVPFWTSLMVRTFAWEILLRDQGPINNVLAFVGIGRLTLYKNIIGVTIGMSHILLPFIVMPIFATMRGIDRRLLLAAESLGAPPWRAFLRVYVPLSLPGVVAGGTLVFVLALGFFITPALLGSPQDSMISQYMYDRVNKLNQIGLAAAIGFVLLVVTLGIITITNRVVRPDQGYSSGTNVR